MFFNPSLEAPGGNVRLKTRTVGKFLELKDKFDLCSLLNSTEFPKGPGIWKVILYLIVTS